MVFQSSKYLGPGVGSGRSGKREIALVVVVVRERDLVLMRAVYCRYRCVSHVEARDGMNSECCEVGCR